MMTRPKVFDCTLREVGYQTGWYFDTAFCRDLYTFAQGKGINYIELGFFHDPEHDKGRGIFRYCSEKQQEISNVFKGIKNRVKISAMIDVQRPMTPLVECAGGVVDTIRILTRSHETDMDILKTKIDEIRTKGYEVFINFTSAGYNTNEMNIDFADFAVNNNVPVIYFADTESVMTEQYVIDAIKICHERGLQVGIHVHDKNGTAEQLTETALRQSVDYIDFTLLGLGGKWRDGNLSTEYYLQKKGFVGGYELTHLKNSLIDQLVKYHEHSAAD
jgi:4-hydroxy 2-oxovalerate aldolase